MARLLIVTDSIAAGQGALVARHASMAQRHGWEVLTVGPPAVSGDFVTDPQIEIPMHATARDLRGTLRTGRAIKQEIRAFQPDIVHCHGARAFVAARLDRSAPMFITLHGVQPVSSDPIGYGAVRRWGLRLLPSLAKGAFADGPVGIPGWHFAANASPRLEGLDRLGPPADDEPMFLWFGRLDEPKRPDIFVHAISLASRRHRLSGVVAGSGPLAPELQRLVERLDAPVTFVGQQAEAVPLLTRCWAVVLCSEAEGLPLALQEAMWAGRAVVATPLPGIEWITAQGGGRLARTPEEVAAELVALCDRDTATKLGIEAADGVRSLMDVEDPWPALAHAYEGVL